MQRADRVVASKVLQTQHIHRGRVSSLLADESFTARLALDGACWIWMGCLDAHGYGKISRSLNGSRQHFLTHRYAWMLAHGPIPDRMQVLHCCDKPACCNPSHLFLGTHADNMADKMAKGRARGGSKGLTLDDARAIRASQESIRALAAQYDVVPSHIRRIRRGEHFAEPHLDLLLNRGRVAVSPSAPPLPGVPSAPGSPPLAAAIGIQAAKAGARAVNSAPAELQCAVGGCRAPRHNAHTGFCAAHHMSYLDHLGEHTRETARGWR